MSAYAVCPKAEMGNMPVVDVGMRKVRVKRLLSEGRYAHVYKVSVALDDFFRNPLVLPSLLVVVVVSAVLLLRLVVYASCSLCLGR